jgi:hypothetical protein
MLAELDHQLSGLFIVRLTRLFGANRRNAGRQAFLEAREFAEKVV